MFKKSTLALAIALASSNSFAQVQELETTKVKGETKENQEVISSLKIEENMVNNLDDLVRDIPGVVIKAADGRWGGTGFNIRGVADDRIAVSIDGIEQGESLQYEGGQAYGYFKGGRNGLELETVKQVSITKGADSVISGSGALGGSVRFVTKDADDFLKDSGDDTAVKLSSSYDSASETAMGSIAAAGRFGGFEALLIGTKRKGHETENHTAGADIDGSGRERPDPQDIDRDNIFLKMNYDFSANNTLGFIVEDRTVETETDARSYNGPWYVGRIGDDTSERQRIGIFQKANVDAGLFDRIEWSIDRQNVDFEAKTHQSVTFYGGLTPRVDTRTFDQELTQFKFDFNKRIKSGNIEHDIFYGFAYSDKEVDNEETRVQTRAGQDPAFTTRQALVPHSEITNYNFFVLDRISLSDDTKLEVGLRYDDYEYDATPSEFFQDNLGGNSLGKQDFNFFSGALGLTQKIGDNSKIIAKIGRAFKAPTVEQLYTRSGSEDNWNTGPNPDLDVETATNYELTFETKTDGARFAVTGFFNKFQDFIENRPLGSRINEAGEVDEYNIPVNVSDADTKGLELIASFDLNKTLGAPEGLSAFFNSAYIDGEQDNGDPLTSVQPFSSKLGISYANETWGVNSTLTYTAAKDAGDAYSTNSEGERVERDYLSNSAAVLDITAFYKLTEQLTLRAGVFNVTDKEYYIWDSIRFVGRDDLRPGIGVRDNGISRYTEPGRNFTVRADFKF